MMRPVLTAVGFVCAFIVAGCGVADDLGFPGFGFRAPLHADGCVVTGCSGHVCADDHMETTCEWREDYACYDGAVCERQADGQCGWTQTQDLTTCLGGGSQQDAGTDLDGGAAPDAGTDLDGGAAPCVRGGCSGQLCGETAQYSTCEWLPEYACYQQATCERQADGLCGFTQDAALQSCLAATQEPEAPEVPEEEAPGTDSGGCFRTGCSSHVCADTDVITTCEWTPAYACFAKANCERQADGLCGFTHTQASLDCFQAASVEK